MKHEASSTKNTNLRLINPMIYAKVAIDIPIVLNLNDYFYYSIPDELKKDLRPGTVVRIPFGKNELNGYVLDLVEQNNFILSKKNEKDFHIKPIYDILYKEPIWDEKFFKLANWISKYYITNIGTVLGASISSEILDHSTNELELINITEKEQLTNEQNYIVDKLLKSKKKSLSYKYLLQKSKLNKQRFYQLISQLKNKGIVKSKIVSHHLQSRRHNNEIEMKESKLSFKLQELNLQPFEKIILNNDQQNAYNAILKSIQDVKPNTFLLHGVTGSGKTEIYLKIIEEVLKTGKTIIYLVPEIYLIPQMYQRLVQRFDPSLIIAWHSSLSKNERLSNWDKLQNNNNKKPQIILGARSAILVPVQDIGLIVVDEAHESSYKQSSPAPRYDAVMVAQKRGEIEKCSVILGSATPNIIDHYYSLQNHTLLELPNRVENLPMPIVSLVDLRNEYPQTTKNIISNILKKTINEALDKKEQIILLLNRRGYSSHIFCRVCGYIQFCKNCSVPMVYHKNFLSIICHHCGYRKSTSQDIQLQCPECKSPHLKYFGLGTQQLEEEVKRIFKNNKIIRVDSDQLRKKDEYINLWQEFSSGKADILIGTQLVAKGLDLPNVTVVGVILADTMLNFPDYVSYERAFQLLTQITGRTGRGKKPGKVFIQTYQVENELFKFIQEHNYKGFYKKEIEQRKLFEYPPYTSLSRIIFQSYSEEECINYADEAMKILLELKAEISNLLSKAEPALADSSQFSFLGPAPCFFTKLNGKYRYHILCKIKDEDTKIIIFNNIFQRLNKNARVELIVDVDSVNLL